MPYLYGYHEGRNIHHVWSYFLSSLYTRCDQVTEEMSYVSEETEDEKHTSDIYLDYTWYSTHHTSPERTAIATVTVAHSFRQGMISDQNKTKS